MNEQPAEAVRDVVRLPFPDRRGAGRALAAALRRRFTGPDGRLTLERPLVLALPRGGVAVAAEVARDLGAPLDVLVTRKIGYPQQPELGVGALAEGGIPSLTTPFCASLASRRRTSPGSSRVSARNSSAGSRCTVAAGRHQMCAADL